MVLMIDKAAYKRPSGKRPSGQKRPQADKRPRQAAAKQVIQRNPFWPFWSYLGWAAGRDRAGRGGAGRRFWYGRPSATTPWPTIPPRSAVFVHTQSLLTPPPSLPHDQLWPHSSCFVACRGCPRKIRQVCKCNTPAHIAFAAQGPIDVVPNWPILTVLLVWLVLVPVLPV